MVFSKVMESKKCTNVLNLKKMKEMNKSWNGAKIKKKAILLPVY